MNIIVTGGAGFIGSNFVFHMLKKYPDYRIICLDKLTYAGNLSTLASVMDNPNFRFVKADICDREAVNEPFGFSLLLSFLAMFFYLYAYESMGAGKGWKNAIVTWYQKFKESVFFRKLFFLAFVTSLILFRTLLNRNL